MATHSDVNQFKMHSVSAQATRVCGNGFQAGAAEDFA
jgi:hypothetical protein